MKMKNKILKLHLLCVFVAVLFANVLKAQDSLYVYDIGAIRVFGKTTISRIEKDSLIETSVHTDTSIKFHIVFKLNDVSLAKNLILKIGNTQNGGEILDANANIIHNQNYVLQYNGNSTEIINNCGGLIVTMNSQQYQQAKWLTIYAKNKNGTFSSKKYFLIQY